MGELRAHLVGLASVRGHAAEAAGARLVAVGATPVRELQRGVPDEPRYREMSRRFGPVAHDPAVCGCHVHVGLPDRDLAVQVCNHLRPWLPVVQAITANSPLHDGRDTGHASWRSMQLERWPSIGPTPHFESAADYDATVADLSAAGIMLDAAMVYWYARPSATYPTVEIGSVTSARPLTTRCWSPAWCGRGAKTVDDSETGCRPADPGLPGLRRAL